LHRERRPEHDQQRRRRHDFAPARHRENPEQRIQQVASDEHETDDGAEADTDREPVEPARRLVTGRDRRQECDERQQRHDHHVLEQQHRNDTLTRGRGELAFFLEQLHDDGRRRQDEARTRDERRRDGKARGDADARQQQRAEDDLQNAEPEDLRPQAPEPRRPHLEADDEQEQHDAELGDVQDRFRVRDQPHAEGPDDEPGREIAEHGAQAEPPKQRHRQHGGRQQRDDFA
jgi:hypothetical protein